MKILFSCSPLDKVIVDVLSTAMRQDGHDVMNDIDYNPGDEWRKELGKRLAEVDIFIPIITKQSEDSSWIAFELGVVTSDKNGNTLVIPIVIETRLPLMISQYQTLFFTPDPSLSPNDWPNQLRDIIEKLRIGISSHETRCKDAEAQKEQERKESVEKFNQGISKHIEPVFIKLEEAEQENKRYAFWLYLISVFSLGIPILVVFLFSNENLNEIEIQYVIVKGIIYLSIIILFISLSKLLFTLAKSFMVEAIRCSDRAHAISFGRFFLDAYGDNVTHEEVISVFNSWNIDNGGTQFRNQSGDDYDPKLSEILTKIPNIK